MISKNRFNKMINSFNVNVISNFNDKFSNSDLINKAINQLPNGLQMMSYHKLVIRNKNNFAIRWLKVNAKFDVLSKYGLDINSFLIDYFLKKNARNEFILEFVITREHTKEYIFSYKEKFII